MSQIDRRRRGAEQADRDAATTQLEGSTHLTEARVRELVRTEVRRLLMRIVDDGPAAYTTRRGDAPPGWADEKWHDVAPTIQGAHRPGRWWVVSRANYEAWLASQNTTTAPAPANDAATVRWDPLASLEASRARRARGGR